MFQFDFEKYSSVKKSWVLMSNTYFSKIVFIQCDHSWYMSSNNDVNDYYNIAIC